MDLSGKVKVIMDVQEFSSGFKKREFVVTTQEQYPQDIKFELVQDRIDLLSNMKQGDDVTVHFDVRGNEYNGRYFVNLRAWRVDMGASAPAQQASGQAQAANTGFAGVPPVAPPPPSNEPADLDEDDLPF